MDYSTSVAVVTGGASGLGRLLSIRLGSRGAHVVVADRDERACDECVEVIAAAGGTAHAAVVDLLDDEAVTSLAASASRVAGRRLGVWVNNAGGWGTGEHQYPSSPVHEWSAALDLNLRTPMLAIQAALAEMGREGGAIVNVSSVAALGDAAYGSPEYAASKAGLIRLTTSLRGLVESDGVRVSCVVPGWIGLPRAHAEGAPPDELIPPDDVVDAVLALIDDDESGGSVRELVRPSRENRRDPRRPE